MGFKWFTVIIGALWWAFGATIDVTVALRSGGSLLFTSVLVVAFYVLYRQGFRRNKSNTDLWVLIFRGLSIEAVLFALAILIMGLTTSELFVPEMTLGDLFTAYGVPGLLVAALLWLSAWLLNTPFRRMHEKLEEDKRKRLAVAKPNKRVGWKKHE